MAELAVLRRAEGATGGILVEVAVVVPVDPEAEERAAEKLLADDARV